MDDFIPEIFHLLGSVHSSTTSVESRKLSNMSKFSSLEQQRFMKRHGIRLKLIPGNVILEIKLKLISVITQTGYLGCEAISLMGNRICKLSSPCKQDRNPIITSLKHSWRLQKFRIMVQPSDTFIVVQKH